MALGAGISATAWGARMILRDDPSADEKVAELLARTPAVVKGLIGSVQLGPDGFSLTLPKEANSGVVDRIVENEGLGEAVGPQLGEGHE